MMPIQVSSGQERVEVIRAENGYMVYVHHAAKNSNGSEAMTMFSDIMGNIEESGDPISAFKKLASKKDMLEKTRRKQEEIYVAKNLDELMNILLEVFKSMES
jgi:hypothetical protein